MEHQGETRTAGTTNLPAVYYNWSSRTATLVPFAFFKEIMHAGPSSSGTLKIGPIPWGSPQIIAQLISLEQSAAHFRPTHLQPIKEKTIYHFLGRSAHTPKLYLLLGNAACWYSFTSGLPSSDTYLLIHQNTRVQKELTPDKNSDGSFWTFNCKCQQRRNKLLDV